jgi:indole-3-glycerol phosphate synthase
VTLPGVRPTDSVLDRIVADKREPLAARKAAVSEATLLDEAHAFAAQRSLVSAIEAASEPPGSVALISEIKKASPSAGVFAPDLDAVAIAKAYAAAGTDAISIVTEANYFKGDIAWMRAVRQSLASYGDKRPALLRKDFIVEAYELAEARAYGADAALLIVAMLDLPLLRDLIQQAQSLQLDPLVEVHNEEEAAQAVAAGARLIGINNRDLHTFKVDLATTERVRPLLPANAVVVGESGIHSRGDVERLARAGVRAILVGEALMRSDDIAATIAAMRPQAQGAK